MKILSEPEKMQLAKMMGRFRTVDIAKRLGITTEEAEAAMNELKNPPAQAVITPDHEKQLQWVVAEVHGMMRAGSYGKLTVCLDKGNVSRLVKEISIMNPD